MSFTKATKKQARGRIAFESPSGFGKSYTALLTATQLLEGTGKRICALDTEGRGQGSLSKYAHLFDFDVDEIVPPFHPSRIIESLADAIAGDYGVWICDSWSHFWQGRGGMLSIVDEIARAKYRGDSHRAWGDEKVTNLEQDVLDALLGAPLHVIVCMRMKTDTIRSEYTDGDRTRTRIQKAGLKAIQREGFDYEFDLVGKFETPTIMTVDKTRIETLPPDMFIEKPAYLDDSKGATADGKAFVPRLKEWLEAGEESATIERPPAADRKTLDVVKKRLAEAKPETDWNEKIEQGSKLKFHVGIEALSKAQFAELVAAFDGKASELEAAKTAEPVGAAA